jgi:cellulose synthase/poly-beta-1,6-N-acetylglucosamine synthase-like glycosyltransferase
MERAQGEFILILDADFVPDPELIHRLLPPFRDDRVGMVQARWDHLNEASALLTRCQALLLDAHFFFEQGGRHATGAS